MNSLTSLGICAIFIAGLFFIERKKDIPVSGAVWVPVVWMMLIGARYVSQWMDLGQSLVTPDDYLEGSVLDRNVFLALTITGIVLLWRRRVSFSRIVHENKAVIALYAYFGLSVLWSDYEYVAMKRWIKAVGTLIMVLIIISERDPVDALKAVIRRSAYLFVPLSIVLIKYFPEYGRAYTPEGVQMFTGVTVHKNSLALFCVLWGLYFIWELMSREKSEDPADRKEMAIHVFFLGMVVWLLFKANSSTSLFCFILGVIILVGIRFPVVRRNMDRAGIYLLLIVVLFVIVQASVDIISHVIAQLGRDQTMTGRTDLWRELVSVDVNALFGTGYESFWLGERAEMFWQRYWWHPNQAHNGYLELYLNLGWFGLVFLAFVLISAYRKSVATLKSHMSFGSFRMVFLMITILYNVTEATFKGMSLMWFIFLTIALDYDREETYDTETAADGSLSGEETERVFTVYHQGQ